MQIEKNTSKLRKHLHQFHNTHELQIGLLESQTETVKKLQHNQIQKRATNRVTTIKQTKCGTIISLCGTCYQH